MKLSITGIKTWITRYGPGELFGTSAALAGGFIASNFTNNPVIIGYAGAWSENIGYYGYFLRREKRDQRVLYNNKASIRQLAKGLLSEFGPGELLDSLIVRPFTMGMGAKLGKGWGLLLGKRSADIIFYTTTTFLYRRKTKRNVDERLQALSNRIYGAK